MINARLTQKSYLGYAKIAKVSQTMMANLDGIIAQDASSAKRFGQLGRVYIVQSDSLKWASVSTLSDAQLAAVNILTRQLNQACKTYIWVMASSHDGEGVHCPKGTSAIFTKIPQCTTHPCAKTS